MTVNPNDPFAPPGAAPSPQTTTRPQAAAQPGLNPADPFAVGASADTSAPFVSPPIKNLGDLLDWQRAALQEGAFHKGTSDANRAALRKLMAADPLEFSGGTTAAMPIGEFMTYGAQHYKQMPHVLQGAYDMVLDTVSDPLTLETLDTGKIFEGGIRLAKPVLNFIDKSDVPVWGKGLVSDIGGAFTKALNFGGDAIVKYGREAANTAIGMLNRQVPEEKEMLRRLQGIDAGIMKGLTPKQTSAVQKIMKGQVPASLVDDPAVHAAVKARRRLTDAIIRMQPKDASVVTQLLKGRGLQNAGILRDAAQRARGAEEVARGPLNETQAAMAPEELAAKRAEINDFINEFHDETQNVTHAVKKGAAKTVARVAGEPRFIPRAITPQRLPPLPDAFQHFLDPATGKPYPGEFTAENVRKDYFPARGQAAEVSANQPARTYDMLASKNPHVKEQSDFHIASRHVQHFEDAFQGMLKSSARAITTNRVKAEMAKIYGDASKVPPAIRDILTHTAPATGTARTVGQKAAESIKGLVNLPKLGIVGTTPIHMFNILSLLAVHAPEQIPEAVGHFASILRAGGDESKRFQAMLPAIERGIDIADHSKGGRFLSGFPFKYMNRLTWDWDTAAKWARSSEYMRQGKAPLDAGVSAANDLVNYKNASPLANFLRWVQPFATFAEGGAKSVLSAVAKRPAMVEGLNRATNGALLGGGNHATDVTSYQPPANVGRGPATYLRSKTSDLWKLPVAEALRAVPNSEPVQKWLLSGRTPQGALTDILTSPIPYARDILDVLPLPGGKTIRGYKPDTLLNTGVFSSTGISLPTKPKASSDAVGPVNPADPFAIATPGAAGPQPKASAAPSGINPADPFAVPHP